jgi:hypothetical protein
MDASGDDFVKSEGHNDVHDIVTVHLENGADPDVP